MTQGEQWAVGLARTYRPPTAVTMTLPSVSDRLASCRRSHAARCPTPALALLNEDESGERAFFALVFFLGLIAVVGFAVVLFIGCVVWLH